ncbi:MAG: threonylcarbamoyl-AMP synthase [Hoeflea sp.]|uniref:L-threonylcarbamoyladenylate synthase n=1 Tax=Hoeflea sp. TaxID=1940281 RepID=UPI001DF9452D|nr:L-threonylcarbamoyladenylate synthase [Hoeflea sp.]MBU4527705.1 threonylcarbamoyl-AMP synthase [Alphaproteobacteria bacterium]MBU4546427.1 threonylcarbamoyl-AMP synthase [Alphaproteobacteria bacterium]MBU4553055.1 threonylcarbamoyl-AMP synthase [Alphaproteobacteria bacterium]MBV1724127.1 threonylcarbamoyl-AMP synthase [Hoeflea sp.]MBV1759812.1 threonylcarbamoyl-AMP synthase [Hoeflea sp.]
MARILPILDPTAIPLAIEALRRGEAVAVPTETVYGLAADATNPSAITAIYEAKGRPRFNPLISHVSDLEMAKAHVTFSPLAERLAAEFWPGALTLVLPLNDTGRIHPLATAGLPTAAVRMPEGFARDLIAAFGDPLAAPSANRSGRVSPTSARHVEEDLGDRIGLILDGGRCRIGVESTILAVEDGGLRLLRPGGIPVEAIEDIAGLAVERHATQPSEAVIAPGMLASHYAPNAAVRLNVTDVRPGETVIRFGGTPLPGEDQARMIMDLSPTGDLREAAANLFDFLKRADASGAACIAVAPVSGHGLGAAINDRLARAAAPRD